MIENLPGYIELEATNNFETPDAVLLDFGGPTAQWIPKSQMEDWPDEGEFGEVLVKEWMAEEKGLI